MSLTLQVCADCGTVQYPRRDVCGACLSTKLEDKDVSPEGTVLSWTRGHVSALPAFQDKTPLTLVRVKLDAGPIVLALSGTIVVTGQHVTIGQKDQVLQIL